MPKQNFSFRIDPSVRQFYDDIFPSFYSGGQYALESFPGLFWETIRELKGVFTPEELSAILEAKTGAPDAHSVGQSLADDLGFAINAEEIDTHALIKKIEKLTAFQRAVMEFWAFSWATKHHMNVPEIIKSLFYSAYSDE